VSRPWRTEEQTALLFVATVAVGYGVIAPELIVAVDLVWKVVVIVSRTSRTSRRSASPLKYVADAVATKAAIMRSLTVCILKN
jgi:hypothetical protein